VSKRQKFNLWKVCWK